MLKRIVLILLSIAWLAPLTRSLAAAEEHGAAAPHAAVATGGEHANAPLLPSNAEEAKEYFLGPAIWTVVIFVVMLAILYPTAWKNVLAGLKKREERIRKDIADAEAARVRAESTLRDYNAQLAAAEARGREILNKATVDAEALATSIRNRAQQESEEIKDRANRDIEAARAQAVADIHRQAADLATAVAEKILRRNLNAADQQDLVRQSLDQLQTVSKN
ncbi:MAG TPA: F0F1 ATP synthase subunit B [Tepidisphaeraceae bacterium]|jgi:F-type H+-transporting ATPase subunit b|nr:F0F1 ATP synthase subunit B [Tepidisphaeraceae bacterium]